MSPKHCPHCLKKIPFSKRLKTRCPYCFKLYRRKSGIQDRSLVGQWLEDRNKTFWFFVLVVAFGVLAVAMQVIGFPDLINFIDQRPVWFAISIFYLAMFASIISRIYFPLLLGAPKILRRERAVIRQYRGLSLAGILIGIPFAIVIVGFGDVWSRLPATVFLMTLPVALFWSYQALTLTDEEYEDERTWSFLQELGAQDRLEHRHNALFVLIGIPLAALGFYYFTTHPVLARLIQESSEAGIIAMLRDAVHRATGH